MMSYPSRTLQLQRMTRVALACVLATAAFLPVIGRAQQGTESDSSQKPRFDTYYRVRVGDWAFGPNGREEAGRGDNYRYSAGVDGDTFCKPQFGPVEWCETGQYREAERAKEKRRELEELVKKQQKEDARRRKAEQRALEEEYRISENETAAGLFEIQTGRRPRRPGEVDPPSVEREVRPPFESQVVDPRAIPERTPARPEDQSRQPREPEYSAEAFQADLERYRRQLDEAERQIRQERESTPRRDERPSGFTPRIEYDDDQPRRGPSRQEDGGGTPRPEAWQPGPSSQQPLPRENRTYATDGSSGTIGRYDDQGYRVARPAPNSSTPARPSSGNSFQNAQRQYEAIQRQSNERIAAIRRNGATSSNVTSRPAGGASRPSSINSASPASVNSTPAATAPRPAAEQRVPASPRITFDDSQPRANAPAARPQVPSVTQRQPGTRSQTASLRLP